MKTLDAITSPTLAGLIDTLNSIGVQKDDIVEVFCNYKQEYVAIFYK